MKIFLPTLGTRGDAEPFLTLALAFRWAGHEVCIGLPDQLTHLAAEAGLEYRPFTPNFLDLLEGETGRGVMGGKGNFLARAGRLYGLYRASVVVQYTVVAEQAQMISGFAPDRIVTHPKCLYARAFGLVNPNKVFVASPVPNAQHASAAHPHIGITTPLGSVGNRWSYALTNGVTARMATKFLSKLPTDDPVGDMTKQGLRHHFNQGEPWFYLVSPALFAKPAEWPDHARLVGYHERPKAGSWSPRPELTAFLQRYVGEGVTLITFGSMVNDDPAANTGFVLDCLRKNNIPALLVTASGGLQLEGPLPDHVLAVDRIPYDWAFPRVQSVVHHGGSGTTHTALRHGRPCMVVPHIIDQFFWNRTVAGLGAGPLGPSIKRLRRSDFAERLKDLRTNTAYAAAARTLADNMRSDDRMMGRIIKIVTA